MNRIAAVFLLAFALTGCASHSAMVGYMSATDAYNKCLLANPGMPDNCAPRLAVMQNELALYNNLSE